MKIKVLQLIIPFFYFTCCTAIEQKKENRIDNNIFSHIDTTNIKDNTLSFYKDIEKDITTKDFYFLCTINADCSNCIADFLKFVERSSSYHKGIPIYVILNSFYSDALKFYAKKAELLSKFTIIEVESDLWEEEIIKDFNELYIMKCEKVVSCFPSFP